MKEDFPAGYRLPLYRSLTEKLLLAGAPKNVIVINAMLAAIFIIPFSFFWILPINLLVYSGSIYFTQKDDHFFECLVRYVRKKDFYCT